MQTFMRELLHMSLSGGLLILVVLVLRLLLKRAPKAIHCVLWAMVAIRLICPFTPQSPLSLIPKDEAVIQTIRHVQEPIAHSDVTLPESAAVGTPAVQAPPPAAAAGTSASPTLSSLLPRFWLAGLTAMLVYMAASYLKVHLSVRESIPGTDNVRFCDRVTTPFVLGFFRPRIYMPTGITREEQRHVLCHENAHLLRRDHWWKPLGFLILSVHWFNPLVWAAYVLFCRDIELACDERVIRKMDEREKADYSRTLLKVSTTRKFVSACPLAFGETSIKRRIKAVLHYKKPAFWIIIVSIVACAVVAVCFLTNPVAPKAKRLKEGESACYNGTTLVFSELADTQKYYDPNLPNATTLRLTRHKEGYDLQFYRADTSSWEFMGTLTPLKLTEDNWDARFAYYGSEYFYIKGVDAKQLRAENAAAWEGTFSDMSTQSYFYTLLEQKNGELYLVSNYADKWYAENNGGLPDTLDIRMLHASDFAADKDGNYWYQYTPSGVLPNGEIRLDAYSADGYHLPQIMLNKNSNAFQLVIPDLGTPNYTGTYTMTEKQLMLEADSGEVFRFAISDDPDRVGSILTFEAGSSDVMHCYRRTTNESFVTTVQEFDLPDGMKFY